MKATVQYPLATFDRTRSCVASRLSQTILVTPCPNNVFRTQNNYHCQILATACLTVNCRRFSSVWAPVWRRYRQFDNFFLSVYLTVTTVWSISGYISTKDYNFNSRNTNAEMIKSVLKSNTYFVTLLNSSSDHKLQHFIYYCVKKWKVADSDVIIIRRCFHCAL